MSKNLSIGLGNSLNAETEILYSGFQGRSGIGRMGDLVAAWTLRQNLPERNVSDARLLVQTLLDYAQDSRQTTPGQFEYAIENETLFVAVRFENKVIPVEQTNEKSISQYWLNSDEVEMIKRVLQPRDRVEVRYKTSMNLIEWRVCRDLKSTEDSLNEVSFLVMTDAQTDLESSHPSYTDLGDLPYQNWLTEVYQNKGQKNRSGEFFVNGDSVQNETEWSRVVADREVQSIDEEVRLITQPDAGVERKFVYKSELQQPEDETIHQKKSDEFVDSLQLDLIKEQVELKNSLKKAIGEAKKRELDAIREVELTRQRLSGFESLLRKKELSIQKMQRELAIVHEKLNAQREQDATAVKGSSSSDVFRVKAVQMFEKLQQVKQENAELRRRAMELQRGQFENLMGDQTSGVNNQVDELMKKLDRNQRALEAEKNKVKVLSERVMVAEKEAQSAAPMVEDLERKVETALKTAQQHKKEADTVKQKLVQAEAEKNKVKNELMKAQAEVKTLLKRHAA